MKNTSLVDGDNCINLIGDVNQFKRSMLLKVRKGPREQLQAIIGTGQGTLSGFEDVASDEEEESKRPTMKSASTMKSATSMSATMRTRTPMKTSSKKMRMINGTP